MILAFLAAAALDPPGLKPQEGKYGPFKVVVAAVPDIEQFDRQWAVRTAGVQLTSTARLTRNKLTYVVVMFGGCQRNVEGKCRIAVKYEIRQPDGTVYEGMDGSKVASAVDVPVSRENSYYLAPQRLGVRIEPGEALGPYEVKVTVSDLVGNHSISTVQTLNAVEAE